VHFLNDQMPDDGTWIFVGSMGDILCPGMKDEWILKLLQFIKDCTTNNKFLLQTKNTPRLLELFDELKPLKEKIILGTTLETNRETPWTEAPPTWWRHQALRAMKNRGFKTFLSLEPLADFDAKTMMLLVEDIAPEAVEIGLENYTSFLPQPPKHKIIALLSFLKIKGIPYVLKENLRHLEETANE